jgi:hypothetical protein
MNNSSRAFTQAAHRAQSQHGSAQAYQLRLAEGFLDRVTVNRIPHSWQRQQVRPIANTELDQRALLKLIDEKTFGFADYRGNRQYLTIAQPFRERSFLLDPARRQRAKLWGRARVIKNDPASIARLSIEAIKRNPSELPCSPLRRLTWIAPRT